MAQTRNAVIAYSERRAAIKASINEVPNRFQKLVETLNYYNYSTENAAFVIAVMFNRNELQDRKRAEFEEYAARVQMPGELRAGSLAEMLDAIPEGLLSEVADIRRDFAEFNAKLNAAPVDIERDSKGAFVLNANKQAELLSGTSYTLTDTEQADFETVSGIVDALRRLRDSYNIRLIVGDFLGDKMHPEKDKPLSELARYIHENHTESRAETLKVLKEREEKERATNEAISAEIAAERDKEDTQGVPIRSNFILAQIRAVREHHAANRGRDKFGTESND